MQQPGGAVVRPRVGLNPIAADAHNEWLYFGPMHGTSLYRIKTALLRDGSLSSEKLAQAVERFSEKPITDGISIDDDGNVYLADLPNNAVVSVSKSGEISTIAADPRLSWVDAFSFGPDGELYAVVNQLHLSPPFQGGKDATRAPFLIIKIPTETRGTVGR
jgi:sugar lactone lactonase YvrE